MIENIDQLRALYGEPGQRSMLKQLPRLEAHGQRFIERSPFCVLATAGQGGALLDATPRGGEPGFVKVTDDGATLLLPDAGGNNRLDSLQNLLADPRVSLLFMVPGVGETLRVVGRAAISVAPDLLAAHTVGGKPPRSVVLVTIESVYFQCSKALVRSQLWDAARHVERSRLPSAGDIFAAITKGDFDSAAYDQAMPERLKATLY